MGFVHVLEMNADGGPVGAQGDLLGPFDDHDGRRGKDVFEAEGFEIVEAFDAIEIDVVNARMIAVSVDEREGGAGDVFFARDAQAADDSFRQSCLPRPEVP